MKLNAFAFFALAAVLIVAGCTSYGGKSSSDQTAGDSDTGTAGQDTGTDAPVKEFMVEGTEFAMNPSTISVQKGDKVKITFKNSGTVIHNFKIDELGIATK